MTCALLPEESTTESFSLRAGLLDYPVTRQGALTALSVEYLCATLLADTY